MAFLRIVLLCVATAVCYGMIHDQVTARICVEYFTIGHPPIFDAEDPTLLGLGWGVVATWWVGVLLGVPLALAARCGPWPKRAPRTLVRPLLTLAGFGFAAAAVAGGLGCIAARSGWVWLVPPLSERVPPDRHVAFLVALWAHSASYLCGALGGLVLIGSVLRSRRRSVSRETSAPSLTPAPSPLTPDC